MTKALERRVVSRKDFDDLYNRVGNLENIIVNLAEIPGNCKPFIRAVAAEIMLKRLKNTGDFKNKKQMVARFERQLLQPSKTPKKRPTLDPQWMFKPTKQRQKRRGKG